MEKIKYLKEAEKFYKKEIGNILFIDKDVEDIDILLKEILNSKFKKIYVNFKYKGIYIGLSFLGNKLIKVEIEDNVFVFHKVGYKRVTFVDNDIPDIYIFNIFKKILNSYLKIKGKQ